MIKPDGMETDSLRASGFLFVAERMEIDALYCDVIVQRWEQFTGQKAERVPAGGEAAHAEG